ncbi:hypothetical protein H2200_000119 [Cladophialophora chaetospira]|uniref:MJ1316 RNA cyclic group end recognition domain-containing protein n=1 Tax=Cladophialophora chaetospira TaxID=386627 RepID=A0AA38XNP5_9EURO|nr:hypothetical protein H2200_000119 [Cladophialophora chaetospira]
MAEPSLTRGSPPDSKSNPIDFLRNVAQEHLKTIDEEKEQERKYEVKKLQDLERYAKHKRRKRETTTTSASDTASRKMRTAEDVLNRLQHDTDLDISQYVVGYLERFEGIKELPVKNWISESTDEEWIPQHRIRYFKKICAGGTEETVWDRDSRVDKIFGTDAGASVVDENDRSTVVSEDGGVRLVS